ncbi:DUF4333 domain-containing protein [Mycolicibacterium sp. XJ870]
MSGPEQPWWVKPGGAPPPGAPLGRPPSRNPPPARANPPVVPRPTSHRPPAAGPPPAPPPPRRSGVKQKSGNRWLVVGAAAAVVLLIAVGLAVWRLGVPGGPRLDVHQAEAGVAEILSNPIHGYGANDIAAVACNNGKNPAIEVGKTFTCAVDINDTLRHVIVEFTDDSGTYAVDGPR